MVYADPYSKCHPRTRLFRLRYPGWGKPSLAARIQSTATKVLLGEQVVSPF